jgi:hypothetical protein
MTYVLILHGLIGYVWDYSTVEELGVSRVD